MIKTLIKNIKVIFDKEKLTFTKYQLSKDSTRILFFFNNEDIQKGIDILKRIFGLYSISPALRTSSNIKNISDKTITVAEKILQPEDSFALRIKRSGNHDFCSQDVGREVGKNIVDHFKNLNLKVDLTNPKKKIFIEVRGDFTYIFTNIIKTDWEGLPIEYDKKIITMDIGRLGDILGGFLLMRRGCELYPILFDLTNNNDYFERWIDNWKEIFSYVPFFRFTLKKVNLQRIFDNFEDKLQEKKYLCGLCRLIRFHVISKICANLDIKIKAFSDGVNFNKMSFCNDETDLKSNALSYNFLNLPIFTPLIGLDSEEIHRFLRKISNNLKTINYCKYKPQNQDFNSVRLMDLYNSLKIDEILENETIYIEDIFIKVDKV
ncbi:MAG: hypothetical protein KGD63_14110 [Candidatus Lokiarchaeota archaeon]|nr:hypothetical protein [Candidatus Lokiarchaeota archaeon]